ESESGGEIAREGGDGRFYSPLVRSIAEKEGLSMRELEQIQGSGREGRVTKGDVVAYLERRKSGSAPAPAERPSQAPAPKEAPTESKAAPSETSYEGRVEIMQ